MDRRWNILQMFRLFFRKKMAVKPPSKTYSRPDPPQYELRRSTRLVAKAALNAKTPKHPPKPISPKRHQLSSYYDFVSTPRK